MQNISKNARNLKKFVDFSSIYTFFFVVFVNTKFTIFVGVYVCAYVCGKKIELFATVKTVHKMVSATKIKFL